jgi:hypothetical protein
MTKLSKDKRDKLLLVIIAAVGVVAVLYFLVITDQKAELNALASKIDALNAKKSSSEKTIKRQADVQANLELQRKNLNAKQAEMPRPGEDSRWFLRIIDDRRSQFGLDIGDIKGPDNADPGILPKFAFKGVSFYVELIGVYTDFGRFLADFENSYPYLRVQLVSIETEGRTRFPAPGALQPLGTQVSTGTTPSNPDAQKLRFTFRVISLVKTPT